MARKFKCKDEALPSVRLGLEKQSCLRRGGEKLSTPASIAAFVREHYGCKPQEVFLVLSLNANSEAIYLHEVSLGGLSATPVDPKVIFAGALLAGATAIVLIHNHPSGSSEPSAHDTTVTQQLVKAGELLTIRVLDHVIVTRGEPLTYVSFAERGLMPGAPRPFLGDETPPVEVVKS